MMTASAFTGAKVISAILFEGTMDGRALEGRQGARDRERRCQLDEADTRARGAARPGDEARHFRHHLQTAAQRSAATLTDRMNGRATEAAKPVQHRAM